MKEKITEGSVDKELILLLEETHCMFWVRKRAISKLTVCMIWEKQRTLTQRAVILLSTTKSLQQRWTQGVKKKKKKKERHQDKHIEWVCVVHC